MDTFAMESYPDEYEEVQAQMDAFEEIHERLSYNPRKENPQDEIYLVDRLARALMAQIKLNQKLLTRIRKLEEPN